jgi:ribosome biogenesis GTPase
MREALVSLGWDQRWAAAFDELGVTDGEPARVTAQHRERWVIHTAAGPEAARILGSVPGSRRPVTGDWVVVRRGPEESDPWGIVSVLPRRSSVRRGAAGDSHSDQVLAANVDRVWIVHALDTPPNLRSIERYLAVVWASGASPEVVLTKSDLSVDLEEAVAPVRAIALGVPVWVVSVEDQPALDALGESLAPGRTVALLGPSGAGKSTLINHLSDSVVTRTNEVRAGDRKGRHTTTGRELFPIRGGALLLDTPGMRELKVLDLDEGLGHTFPEIDELAAGCRFRDCSHSSEPECAVLAAVDQGLLGSDRLASYRKLMAEAAFEGVQDRHENAQAPPEVPDGRRHLAGRRRPGRSSGG